MPPLPPEDALPHVEDAAMLQAMALIEPKWVAVDRGGQTGPVRCRHNARYGAHLGIEYSRQESRGCGERAAFRKRATRSCIAIADREQRLQLVLARERKAFIDEDPPRIDGGCHRQSSRVSIRLRRPPAERIDHFLPPWRVCQAPDRNATGVARQGQQKIGAARNTDNMTVAEGSRTSIKEFFFEEQGINRGSSETGRTNFGAPSRGDVTR